MSHEKRLKRIRMLREIRELKGLTEHTHVSTEVVTGGFTKGHDSEQRTETVQAVHRRNARESRPVGSAGKRPKARIRGWAYRHEHEKPGKATVYSGVSLVEYLMKAGDVTQAQKVLKEIQDGKRGLATPPPKKAKKKFLSGLARVRWLISKDRQEDAAQLLSDIREGLATA